MNKPELGLIVAMIEEGQSISPGAARRLLDEVNRLKQSADNYRLASLGMFDPVRVGQVVAQLQMERDQARAATRELLMCWVPPEHQNDYLKHWDWLKIAEREAGQG